MPDKATMEEQAMFDRERKRAHRVLSWIDSWMEDFDKMGMRLRKLTVKAPSEAGGDLLLVFSAQDEKGQLHVAFSGGETVTEALSTAAKIYDTRGLKWREDTPLPTAPTAALERAKKRLKEAGVS